MAEQTGARSNLEARVAQLKSKIPPMEHAALDSRLEGLLNDSSATSDEVIAALVEEFDPPQE